MSILNLNWCPFRPTPTPNPPYQSNCKQRPAAIGTPPRVGAGTRLRGIARQMIRRFNSDEMTECVGNMAAKVGVQSADLVNV